MDINSKLYGDPKRFGKKAGAGSESVLAQERKAREQAEKMRPQMEAQERKEREKRSKGLWQRQESLLATGREMARRAKEEARQTASFQSVRITGTTAEGEYEIGAFDLTNVVAKMVDLDGDPWTTEDSVLALTPEGDWSKSIIIGRAPWLVRGDTEVE